MPCIFCLGNRAIHSVNLETRPDKPRDRGHKRYERLGSGSVRFGSVHLSRFDISPTIITETASRLLQSPKSLNVDMNNTSEMQAATEDTTSTSHDMEKDTASSKPEPESIDDVLETPQVDLAVPANPPTAPKITYPGFLVASILNVAIYLCLFLVALDLVST